MKKPLPNNTTTIRMMFDLKLEKQIQADYDLSIAPKDLPPSVDDQPLYLSLQVPSARTLQPRTLRQCRARGSPVVLFTGQGVIIRKGEKSLLWKGLTRQDLTF